MPSLSNLSLAWSIGPLYNVSSIVAGITTWCLTLAKVSLACLPIKFLRMWVQIDPAKEAIRAMASPTSLKWQIKYIRRFIPNLFTKVMPLVSVLFGVMHFKRLLMRSTKRFLNLLHGLLPYQIGHWSYISHTVSQYVVTAALAQMMMDVKYQCTIWVAW